MLSMFSCYTLKISSVEVFPKPYISFELVVWKGLRENIQKSEKFHVIFDLRV
jgi:hypothetical protein